MKARRRQYRRIGNNEAKRLYSVEGVICEDCSDKPAIHRHHIDGNTHNNARNNIMLLCHSCHLRVERKARRVGSRTRLTRSDIARIKAADRNIPNESISALAAEFNLSGAYLRRIRSGEKDPMPVSEFEVSFKIPAGFRYKERRGKKRALTVKQVRVIWSYKPTLGTASAERLALKFGVSRATIWKARAGRGCYADFTTE